MNHVNNKVNETSIHNKLQQINLNGNGTKYDATSLYPPAIWDEKSVYPKIETGFAFKLYMNDV